MNLEKLKCLVLTYIDRSCDIRNDIGNKEFHKFYFCFIYLRLVAKKASSPKMSADVDKKKLY